MPHFWASPTSIRSTSSNNSELTKGVECYQKVISTSTVYRLSGQKKKTGSVERQTSQRGRKPALTEEDLQGIDQLIAAQPDITIGERSADKTPLNTPANTTILSSIRRNGETAYTIYSGGTTREKFLDYLKETLIPTLHEGDIVVMDNMRTHHGKEVRTLLEGAGMKLRYLPQLPHGIAEAFSLICPSDCIGWFSAAGIPC